MQTETQDILRLLRHILNLYVLELRKCIRYLLRFNRFLHEQVYSTANPGHHNTYYKPLNVSCIVLIIECTRRQPTPSCSRKEDIVFLFDDSNSINSNDPQNFNRMKVFMKDVVDSFTTIGTSGKYLHCFCGNIR